MGVSMSGSSQPWKPRPFVSIGDHCEDDPDFPGLCAMHEVVHLAGDRPPSACEHDTVRLLDGGHWQCARCGKPFRPTVD